ncbi:E3 ubiquitin-protein ligase Mdm2 isoform X2 [Stigmatopora argus]
MDHSSDCRLVRPTPQLADLLKQVGSTKDVMPMQDVTFYVGKYISMKELYDKEEQHIVRCAQDPLGNIMGVESFSVKEPRAVYAKLNKNVVTVRRSQGPSPDSSGASGSLDRAPQAEQEPAAEPIPSSESGRRRRWSSRSNGAGPSIDLPVDDDDDDADGDEGHGVKRGRSDNYPVVFHRTYSWYLIGGLDATERLNDSQAESQSVAGHSDVTDSTLADDSDDDDDFSVEYELRSSDPEEEEDDDSSLSADSDVCELTTLADDSDDDTEITEADFWRCEECTQLKVPLPSNCMRCWCLRQDWLRQASLTAAPADATGSDAAEGVDVPDGKTVSRGSQTSRPSSSCSSAMSQERACPADSGPPSVVVVDDSQEPGGGPAVSAAAERGLSADMRLPESCLEPCLICQSHPKNGCIVHGKTGHLMSCYACARKLKKRNKLCPMCRQPIQAVVLTYFG